MSAVPWPRLKRDWLGRRVRLLRPFRNRGGVTFRKGRTMMISGYFRGLELRGRRDVVSRVPITYVELLP